MVRCEKCGRTGVKQFETLPEVTIANWPKPGETLVLPPIDVCTAKKACMKRSRRAFQGARLDNELGETR